MQTPKVYVVYRSNRNKFTLEWRDTQGKKRQKTSQAKTRRLAEREAADLETELAETAPGQGWAEFVLRYEREQASAWKRTSHYTWNSALAALNRFAPPNDVTDINAAVLSKLVAGLRKEGKTPATIRGYLKYLRAALYWARDVAEVINEVPRFRLPKEKAGRQARSRPVTGEEFERILGVIPQNRPNDYESWRAIVNGMYWGGLRLSEAVELSWDWTSDFAILLDHDPPVIKFSSEQKSTQDQLLPMVPEFRELCESLPRYEKGKVFRGLPNNVQYIGKRISIFGELARVVVNDSGKFASSHDFRRAFGTRWATRLKPAELKEIMRHKDIETTMKYYVELDLRELSEKLESFGKPRELSLRVA